MSESKPVDIDREKRITLEPGPPVEAIAPSQMGSTFAERAAAAKAATKAVKADDPEQGVEDKAVKKAATKAKKKP